MKNVSTTFKTELNNDRRNYIKSCDITLSDGTKLSIENRHIWNNGFKVEDAVSGENSFDIGSAIIGKFTLIINNIYDDFSDYDFTDAVVSNIKVGLKLPDGTTESVKKGIYTVDEANYNGSIITLECLDNMAKFDRSYSESNLTYPATIGAIIRDACSCCGVSLSTDSAAFDNDDFVVQSRPDDSNLTFRQVLFWVGQISCHWCRCNESGQLSLGWYDLEYFEKMRQLIDGGTFSPWSSGDSVDGGTFSPWNAGDAADGGTFEDQKKYHHIYSMASMTICTDDVVITGVKVVEKAKDSEIDDIAYQSGSDGYVLSIEGNELIQDGAGAQVASYLGNKLNGLRFRPLSVDCLSDPSIEAGDVAFVTDRKGNSYATLITNVTFQSGNYEKISCGAESPRRKSADRYSEATRIYQELRKKLSRNKTEWEKAVEDLTNTLASSSGLFITTEEQEDGSSIYCMHNKKNLSESDIVWKITAEGFGISTDGGKTYPFGFKVTGEMITKILNTIGINADWINSGTINADLIKAGTLQGVKIIGESGTVGGFTMTKTKLYAGNAESGIVGMQAPTDTNLYAFYAGATSTSSFADAPFRVTKKGKLYATGGVFSNVSISGGNINLNNDDYITKVIPNGFYITKTSVWEDSTDSNAVVIKQNDSSGGLRGYIFVNGENPYTGITNGNTEIYGGKITTRTFNASGTKSRVVKTKNYGKILQYCYEMPSPMFGDIGCGAIDENGECYIFIDDMFGETVTSSMDYYVFLQKEGLGDLYVAEKKAQYFLAKGTAGLKFSWEIKVRQMEYEYNRLEVDGIDELKLKTINYEAEAQNMVSEYYASLENAFEQEVVS